MEENGNPENCPKMSASNLSESCTQVNPGEASTPLGGGGAMGEPAHLPSW